MSKKPPKGNIIPFANKSQKDDMMDILSSMAYEDIELQTSDYFAEQIVNILPKVMSTAIDMTKLVIENRVRNAEKMTDEDIYQIYNTSFKRMHKVLSEE
ncbi:hypothetical protein [Rickettsia endosymbiont of Urophora cardui]|uniref:hypothetical protein n=1 Tax=Rickettsia endosymbiont of Urophora cardui TaxID=3066265 RepID=UPI00313CA268